MTPQGVHEHEYFSPRSFYTDSQSETMYWVGVIMGFIWVVVGTYNAHTYIKINDVRLRIVLAFTAIVGFSTVLIILSMRDFGLLIGTVGGVYLFYRPIRWRSTRKREWRNSYNELVAAENEFSDQLGAVADSSISDRWEPHTDKLADYDYKGLESITLDIQNRNQILTQIRQINNKQIRLEHHTDCMIPQFDLAPFLELVSDPTAFLVKSSDDQVSSESFGTHQLLDQSEVTLELEIKGITRDAYALHSIFTQIPYLSRIHTKKLCEDLVDLEDYQGPDRTQQLEDYKSIIDLNKRIVVLFAWDEAIQLDNSILLINEAIKDRSESSIASASERVERQYSVLKSVEEVRKFITEVDTTHTSVNTENWEETIRESIQTSDPNVLNKIEDQIQQLSGGIWKKKHLFQYSWQDFEYLIADLWAAKGYRTNVGKQVADMGIDVEAVSTSEKIAIQAKQYSESNKVGASVIRNTAGLLPRGYNRVVVVTSSSFTAPAIKESLTYRQNQMQLLNGSELISELNTSNLAPPSTRGGRSVHNRYTVDIDIDKVVWHKALGNPASLENNSDIILS